MKIEDFSKAVELKRDLDFAKNKVQWIEKLDKQQIVIEIDPAMPLYHDIRQFVLQAYEQVVLDIEIKLKDLGVEI